MSQHIRIGPEPVLSDHAPSLPAAGSHCPAREDLAPHCGIRFFFPCPVPACVRLTGTGSGSHCGVEEAKRDVKLIGEDKDRQLESLWRETRIGDGRMLRMNRIKTT
jgi:hypothetical protein